MLVLEWLVKENRLSYIVEWNEFTPYEDENFKYIQLPDDILPFKSYEFLEFIHRMSDEGYSMLNSDGSKSSYYNHVLSAWTTNIEAFKTEMREIEKWLADNDYKVNKRFLGEYTEESPAWIEYKIKRNEKRLRYNELESFLNL
jgi:hypothetical protein